MGNAKLSTQLADSIIARYGSKSADRQFCFSEIEKQFRLFYTLCRKKDSGLLYHGWSDDGKSAWACMLAKASFK